jgi:large subunit ribosomal protein L16
VAVVRPGRVVFELSYPDEGIARQAMSRAIQKLPVKARIITRVDGFDG